MRKPKWQDVVFGLGNVVFDVGLAFSIVNAQRPDPINSLSTALVLLGFLACYFSMRMWWGFVFTAIGACEWFVLFVGAV